MSQIDEILNDRLHDTDCYLGYKHSDGKVEGCWCWKTDPTKALKELLLSEAKEYELTDIEMLEHHAKTPLVAIPIEAINRLFGE